MTNHEVSLIVSLINSCKIQEREEERSVFCWTRGRCFSRETTLRFSLTRRFHLDESVTSDVLDYFVILHGAKFFTSAYVF